MLTECAYPDSIVFSDLDGTFVAFDKTVPSKNLALLDELARRDIPFVPCTGRAYAALPEVLLSHPAIRYAIVADGAAIMEVGTGRCLHSAPMGEDRMLALYGRVKDLPCTFDVFAGGRVYAERRRFEQVQGFGLAAPALTQLRGSRTLLNEPASVFIRRLTREGKSIERVSIYWGADGVGPQVVSAAEADTTLAHTTSEPRSLEVMDARASKGAGLLWLCNYLDIDPSSAIAFGDSPNDLSMIRAAGTGVAIGNAHPEVLAAADAVASQDNDHAGVACYLEGALGTSLGAKS